jgi:tRNA pseudouridine38-40 synthase
LPNELTAAPVAPGKRLKLLIAYDGASFSGWQSQANSDTIQDRIERAFANVTGRSIRVHGAGRTDAGVHALGQCAHADVPAGKLTPLTWTKALNASLPPQIRILRGTFVTNRFHARFSARGKIYRYRIVTGPVLPPFEVDRAWHVIGALDHATMQACATDFCGRHDFAGFAANRGKRVESTVRTMRTVKIRREAGALTIVLDGEGFLYKMARLIVGAMVRCGLGEDSREALRIRLRTGTSAESARLVAPAGGLTLVRVRY